jgi:hypothetical protein
MAFKLSALGASNGSSGWTGTYATDTALFLKVFAGEVLTTFETSTVMLPLHTVRTISEGKSAQFPVTGTAAAGYHTPGQSIYLGNQVNGFVSDNASTYANGAEITGFNTTYLNQIKHAEKVINIDDELIAATFISKLDEARNHYDVRSIYSTELGRALAKQMDKNLIGLGVLAARASTTITGGNGGSSLDISTAASRTAVTAADLIAGIHDAAQKLDEKDVPSEDRYCIVEPWAYYKLVQDKSLVNKDFSAANGDFAGGIILEAAGVKIIKSNNAASVFGVNVSSVTGQQNTYSGNFSSTVALVFHKSAIGTVKLMDLKMETEYSVERRGNLMVAGYAIGHGILRPEAAVELKQS